MFKPSAVRYCRGLGGHMNAVSCSQNGTVRQQIIETFKREIMEYDAEFRREDAHQVRSPLLHGTSG
jgi:hypothetical protein